MSFLISGTKALEQRRDFYQQPDPKTVMGTVRYPKLNIPRLTDTVNLAGRVANVYYDPRHQGDLQNKIYERTPNNADIGMYDVDEAIIVEGSSKETRADNVEFWNGKVKSSTLLSKLSIVAAVVAVVGAAALIGLSICFTGGIALAAVAVVCVALAVLAHHRSNQAKEQAHQWSFTPGELVALKRSEYYQLIEDSNQIPQGQNFYCQDIEKVFRDTFVYTSYQNPSDNDL
jgi:hypothetical protein